MSTTPEQLEELARELDECCEPREDLSRLPPTPGLVYDTIAALRSAAEELERMREALDVVDGETLCPECGIGVSVDEDGCCVHCGATATGRGVRDALAEIQRLRAERDTAIAVMEREREIARRAALGEQEPGIDVIAYEEDTGTWVCRTPEVFDSMGLDFDPTQDIRGTLRLARTHQSPEEAGR